MIPTIIIVSVVAVGIVLFFVIQARVTAGKKEKLSPEAKTLNKKAAKLHGLAKKGDGEAAFNLYLMGKENLTVKGFKDKYKEYWTHLERAAKRGYPQAQYEYGLSKLYLDGALAVPYLEKAAEAGVIKASLALVRFYDTLSIGIKYDNFNSPDKKTCIELKAKWLKVAAEAGDDEAQASLGFLLLNELKDTRGALYWFEKAADKENSSGFLGVAQIYEKRGGYEKALKYYTLAAKQDYTSAQYMLGKFYLGDYAYDKEKALFWLNKAAEKGDIAATPAMDFLAQAYEKGEIVEADPEKAAQWRKSIEKAFADFRKRNDKIEAKAEKDLQDG